MAKENNEKKALEKEMKKEELLKARPSELWGVSHSPGIEPQVCVNQSVTKICSSSAYHQQGCRTDRVIEAPRTSNLPVTKVDQVEEIFIVDEDLVVDLGTETEYCTDTNSTYVELYSNSTNENEEEMKMNRKLD